MLLMIAILINVVSILIGAVLYCDRQDYFGKVERKARYTEKFVTMFPIKKIKLSKSALEYLKYAETDIDGFYDTLEECMKLLRQFWKVLPEDTAQRCRGTLGILMDAYNNDLETYLHWHGLYENDRICQKTFFKVTATIVVDLNQVEAHVEQLMLALEEGITGRVKNGDLLNASKGECLDRYLDILGEGEEGCTSI